jgi:hypothetical protein
MDTKAFSSLGNYRCDTPKSPRSMSPNAVATIPVMSQGKPKRRWYQFSLRTLLVFVTLAAPIFSWVGYSLNWIRQRREALSTGFVVDLTGTTIDWSKSARPRAPGGLWLFGEQGVGYLKVRVGSSHHENRVNHENVWRLFPESRTATLPP